MKRFYIESPEGRITAILSLDTVKQLIQDDEKLTQLIADPNICLQQLNQVVVCAGDKLLGTVINAGDKIKFGYLSFDLNNEKALKGSGL